jgi:hypothetical protein
MDPAVFDTWTRRASLATLGATAAAVLMSPIATSGKKKKKKKKFDVNTFCKQEVEECETLVNASCAGDPSCPAQVLCCEDLVTCDFAGFFTCLQAAQQP